MGLRTVGVKLTANVSEYLSNMKQAGGSTKQFVGTLDQAAKKGQLDTVADRAGAVGLGLAGMAAAAIKSAADFDKSMSAVSAATHASKGDIDQLRAAALQAGKDTQYSATEAADGITELAKAGVSTADILNGGLKGALSLAAAGQISVGDAAETAASALTQFKLQGSQVPHVADLLAAGAGKAQGSVGDLGYALNQSGLVAAQFGLSIEDTTGALAEFASAGLLGSDAGTSLKTMLLAIANPSAQTKAKMDELGISFYDATGKFIGLNGVAQVLQTRLKGVDDATRQQALGQIFGNDAIRAASILYTDGAKGVDEWKNKVNDAGYAADTAAKLTDNLSGDMERLKGSIETLFIQSGGGANSGLRLLVKAVNSVVNSFLELPPAISGSLTVVVGISGILLLGVSGWIKMRKAVADARTELEKIGPVGVKASTGISRMTAMAGKAGAVLAGLQLAGAALNAGFGNQLNPQIDALVKSLDDWTTTGKTSGEATRLLGDNFKHLGYDLSSLGSGFWAKFGNGISSTVESLTQTGDVFDESLTHAKERIGAIDQALTQMVQNGQSAQAAQVFTMLSAQAKDAGISVGDLQKGLPGYTAALQTAGKATGGTATKTGDLNSALQDGADAQDKYKTAADLAAGAAKGEKAAISDLADELKKQTDPIFAYIDAQKQLGDKQKAYTKAVQAHGAGSKEARDADLDLAKAAVDLQGKVGDLGDTFSGKLSPQMIAALHAAHLTDAQINTIAGSFRGAKKDGDAYAKNYAASVSVSGVSPSVKGLKDLKYEINTLKGKTVTVHVRQVADGPERVDLSGHRIGGYSAAGGPVTGPGPKGVDSELRMLAPGEHVLSDKDVDAMGGQAAVSRFRAGLHHQAGSTMHAPPAPRMTPYAAASQTVVVEGKQTVEFAGRQDQFGTLFLNMLRTSPSVRTEAARILAKAG